MTSLLLMLLLPAGVLTILGAWGWRSSAMVCLRRVEIRGDEKELLRFVEWAGRDFKPPIPPPSELLGIVVPPGVPDKWSLLDVGDAEFFSEPGSLGHVRRIEEMKKSLRSLVSKIIKSSPLDEALGCVISEFLYREPRDLLVYTGVACHHGIESTVWKACSSRFPALDFKGLHSDTAFDEVGLIRAKAGEILEHFVTENYWAMRCCPWDCECEEQDCGCTRGDPDDCTCECKEEEHEYLDEYDGEFECVWVI